MSYIWEHNELSEADKSIALSLANSLGINPVMGTLLVNRGIRTEDEARRFFRPQLTHLLDPFLFEDMQKAVDRLNEALGKKERILVYGDYDVDGCTAVALVYRFLQQYYSNIDYYIPSRNEEGYGVSRQGVNYAHETGVGLVIVLDCGIKAVEEITYAKELGIDFIICDHHVPDPVLPPAVAILNAKKEDSTYPYKDLCGCGVGFKLMQGFAINNGIEFCNLIPLLDLCAISIASDIVPIMGENRILAYHGLRQLNQNPSTGVKALIDICGLTGKDLSLNDIIFKIVDGKHVDKKYTRIKKLIEELRADTTGAFDRFMQYRKVALFGLREKELREASANKATGKNVKLFISAEKYNLTPEYDFNNLMELKKDCDNKSAVAKRAAEIKRIKEAEAKVEELRIIEEDFEKEGKGQMSTKIMLDKLLEKFGSKKSRDRNRPKFS